MSVGRAAERPGSEQLWHDKRDPKRHGRHVQQQAVDGGQL
jgi:hypothetical protein